MIRRRPAPPQVDGLNLARIFPGNPAGTPSMALAARLLSLTRDALRYRMQKFGFLAPKG